MNRITAFKALVGSHNYNLNTPDSDEDYKVFVYPTFDDLYSGQKYANVSNSDGKDVEYHDIRKLPDMLWKSNVNFVELLFSQKYDSYDDLYEILRHSQDKIARMNLPYLYDACMGMFNQQVKLYQKKINSDTNRANKHAMTGIRIVDFLKRYAEIEFQNFQAAVQYGEKEYMRKKLLNIKSGKLIGVDEFIESSNDIGSSLKNIYKENDPDYSMKRIVEKEVKEFVEANLHDELHYELNSDLTKDWIEAPLTEEDRKRLIPLKEKIAQFNRNYNEEEGIIRFEPKKD